MPLTEEAVRTISH